MSDLVIVAKRGETMFLPAEESVCGSVPGSTETGARVGMTCSVSTASPGHQLSAGFSEFPPPQTSLELGSFTQTLPEHAEASWSSTHLMAASFPSCTKPSEKDPKILLCEYCDASFTSKSGLYYHKASLHLQKKFVCKVCGKVLRRKENLLNHMFTHSGPGSQECQFCNIKFGAKHLKNHMIEAHREELEKQMLLS